MGLRDGLAVLPQLPVRTAPNGSLVLTQKFIEGMRKYAEYWGGPVTAIMQASQSATSNLDEVANDPASFPFKVETAEFSDPRLSERLAGYRCVVGSTGFQQNHLPALCKSINVPFVYVAEYSLKTRMQVIRSDVRNPVVALRRQWWELGQERRQRRAIALASGIQCNGTPTHQAYRSVNANPLLYFDTRVAEDMLVDDATLTKRTTSMTQGGPLRLLFSGRLIPMKGADHLVMVAVKLRQLGVPFLMTICGGGQLEPALKADIERFKLGDCVKLAGTLDFARELLPFTKESCDLFVCCHRTGDPSCTYLEVMSCGVPIVGYDNEAFEGIVRESGVGWLTRMNRPKEIAEKIAWISANRGSLLEASKRAVEFGRRHTFERTFAARVDHMKACSA